MLHLPSTYTLELNNLSCVFGSVRAAFLGGGGASALPYQLVGFFFSETWSVCAQCNRICSLAPPPPCSSKTSTRASRLHYNRKRHNQLCYFRSALNRDNLPKTAHYMSRFINDTWRGNCGKSETLAALDIINPYSVSFITWEILAARPW